MYPPITYSLLVEKQACQSQLYLFEHLFGKVNAIPLTSEVVDKFSSLFSIDWAANNLLTNEDSVEYVKGKAPAYAEYMKVINPAYAEYMKVTVRACWEKFMKDKAIAYEEYLKVSDPAYAEYNKAIALIFIEIYKRGLK